LLVDHGSLSPALQRLEARGAITAKWGTSDNNRKARFNTRTSKGRKETRGRGAQNGGWRRRRQHSRHQAVTAMTRPDEDLKAEIESHIALETDRLVDEGLSPEVARDSARREFGRVIAVQERYCESIRIILAPNALANLVEIGELFATLSPINRPVAGDTLPTPERIAVPSTIFRTRIRERASARRGTSSSASRGPF
jgi:DNA-binding PadR family transcriptional regulator